jgi:ppGpp synthetase/RelA/SpoT-type nucleotidyltranferase
MTKETSSIDQKWTRRQVEEFKRQKPNYKLFAEVLANVLRHVAKKLAPHAIVQSRSKAIASFAEKCQRKRAKYDDAINQFTDLCGGRVIVHTSEEVKAISDFIEQHFKIDIENSIDVSQRLKPTEFGYRSVHYIISFKPGVFPNKDVPIEIPPILYDHEQFPNHRAEVQVRTILEHAWADLAHDLEYKNVFEIPAKWKREFAGVAAMLESADKSFTRIKQGLKTYVSSYGAYLSEYRMLEEIKLLDIILECDKENAEVASRIGKLAMTLGDWQKAEMVLSPFVDSGYPGILRDLGVAKCKLNHAKPNSKDYKLGQRYLELACGDPVEDIDAVASLAGTWKGVNNENARALYRKAFQLDPSNPYPLENYLDLEIAEAKDVSVISLLTPVIETAIKRCSDQAEVGVNLPWAYFMMGKFFLLLNDPFKSLEAYAKAVELSNNSWVIESAIKSIERLRVVANHLNGYEWVWRLLLIGKLILTSRKCKELFEVTNLAEINSENADSFKAIKEKNKEAKLALEKLKELAIKRDWKIEAPVVIIAGGCDPSVEQQILNYRKILLEAFSDFRGTVIGGGTTEGISGLVGELSENYPKTLRTIGYLPKLISVDTTVDRRYTEIRETSGNGFSPFESLQYWIDLISSGVDLTRIKVLGINGGAISALEYRMALAFGITVGVVEESGREVTKLLQDEKWMKSRKLYIIPADTMTLRAFVGSEGYKLEKEIRETLAKEIHKTYCLTKQDTIKTDDPAMTSWECLSDSLKESNAQQADHIIEKLYKIGCRVRKANGDAVKFISFTNDEIEFLAMIEHGRWNIERLTEGWTHGLVKDVASKKSPYLVGWNKLPEDVKDWDRAAVRKIPECMAKAKLEIYRTRIDPFRYPE